MNPAIVLVCTTLVSNAASGTIATKSCIPEHAPIILAAASMAKTLSIHNQFEMMNTVVTPRPDPVAEMVQHSAPKHLKVADYQPRHRYHHLRSRVRVIPTASESPPPRKEMSFWDKLKAIPDQISKSITIE